jgi:hypothetical protein
MALDDELERACLALAHDVHEVLVGQAPQLVGTGGVHVSHNAADSAADQ